MSKYADIQAVMSLRRREQELNAERCRIARSKEFLSEAYSHEKKLSQRKIMRALANARSIEHGISMLMELYDVSHQAAVSAVAGSESMRRRFGGDGE